MIEVFKKNCFLNIVAFNTLGGTIIWLWKLSKDFYLKNFLSIHVRPVISHSFVHSLEGLE
jgi:hypothetical protein